MKTRKVHNFLPNGQQNEIPVFRRESPRELEAWLPRQQRRQTNASRGGRSAGPRGVTVSFVGIPAFFFPLPRSLGEPTKQNDTLDDVRARDVMRESNKWRFARGHLVWINLIVCMFQTYSQLFLWKKTANNVNQVLRTTECYSFF